MSRVLAALEQRDSPQPNGDGAPMLAILQQLGEKRKRELSVTGTPSNKRKQGTRLPSELLSTMGSPASAVQPPGAPHGSQASQAALAILRRDPGQFGLNYDTESPLTRMDFGGEDQQQRMAEFVSQSLENTSSKMLVKDGLKYLKLKDSKDLLPGMEVRLIAHQIIGVTWMLTQERESPYKGGILADEMGLGKTVQMIATMAANMPDVNEKHRTTLIVVPAALLHQWKEELETKTNDLFSVHIHHGKDKLKSLEDIQSKDVIITTYQTLNLDFYVEQDGVHPERGGLLGYMKWYRVILDEAQFIRNRSTRSSKTVAVLQTKYRWMLTGTPVTNSLADIYGLIRFGRFRPWNDWPSFDEHIAKVQVDDPPLAGLRAQEILKPVLLRRTKNSTLEGEPLLKLPPKIIELVTEDFSADERELYDNFEKRAKIQVNKFIRQNTILKKYVLVTSARRRIADPWLVMLQFWQIMILRLRQLCCHPNLILSRTEDDDDPAALMDSQCDKELARAKRVMGSGWVTDIKKRFLGRARAVEMDFTEGGDDDDLNCPVCGDEYLPNSGRVMACGHEICHDCLLNLSHSPMAHDGIFGEGSEQQNLQREKQFEMAEAQGLRPCPTCKIMNDLRPNKVFLSAAFEPTEEELRDFEHGERSRAKRAKREPSPIAVKKPVSLLDIDSIELSDSDDDEMPAMSQILASATKKTPPKGRRVRDDDLMDFTFGDASRDLGSGSEDEGSPSKSKGKGKALARDRSSSPIAPDRQMVATWRKGDSDMEPSTKMLALIRLLKEAAAVGDKTIVYSQWTSMLDLIETLFSRYGIRNLRYDGKMSREARDQTIIAFRKSDSHKVILISTKCGGVGLNLVAANRVVNMDLSWNYAAESQAYDRVHRMGQEKDVFVRRLVVSNTIEERMLRLQDVKTGLADAALGEGTGVKLHKMSVKEIKLLFGITPAPAPQANTLTNMPPS
ncbi:SNF2 family N-terminal domain-containing protein [Amylostereum chailletii]|nr:SNF2 family N-terminal domain-containing protein [Amylostereum chailletii]